MSVVNLTPVKQAAEIMRGAIQDVVYPGRGVGDNIAATTASIDGISAALDTSLSGLSSALDGVSDSTTSLSTSLSTLGTALPASLGTHVSQPALTSILALSAALLGLSLALGLSLSSAAPIAAAILLARLAYLHLFSTPPTPPLGETDATLATAWACLGALCVGLVSARWILIPVLDLLAGSFVASALAVAGMGVAGTWAWGQHSAMAQRVGALERLLETEISAAREAESVLDHRIKVATTAAANDAVGAVQAEMGEKMRGKLVTWTSLETPLNLNITSLSDPPNIPLSLVQLAPDWIRLLVYVESGHSPNGSFGLDISATSDLPGASRLSVLHKTYPANSYNSSSSVVDLYLGQPCTDPHSISLSTRGVTDNVVISLSVLAIGHSVDF